MRVQMDAHQSGLLPSMGRGQGWGDKRRDGISWSQTAPQLSADSLLAAAIFAADPHGTGLALRGRAGPLRDAWLALVRDLLPADAPLKRIPLNVADDRLLGGLDLPATLSAGRPVASRGLLAEADGGVIVLPSAERIGAGAAARISAALDTGRVMVERDSLALGHNARFGVIALDESVDDERLPAALADRLALHFDMDGPSADEAVYIYAQNEIAQARARLPQIVAGEKIAEALCGAALALGAGSLRASIMALRVAKIVAALDGRDDVSEDDAVLSARLVLGPRATRLPQMQNEETEQPPEPPPPEPPQPDSDDPPSDETQQADKPLDDVVLAAAAAAIPPGLLARLKLGLQARRAASAGKSGAVSASRSRGRPLGARRGELRSGARLNVLETLRAAAPWQRLRRTYDTAPARVEVRRDDFRITRFKRRTETVTIFVVDASGSAALNRLAEAKGAIELLLADCYVRRDQVALISFRGQSAELLLPPTRSLARAKRSLAGLPGGGGTPLAAGLDAACALAESIRHKGRSPSIVVLTDGRANVARDANGTRDQAQGDAIDSARAVRAAGFAALMVDTSPKPRDEARRLAMEMDATYLPLPRADAASLSSAVRIATRA